MKVKPAEGRAVRDPRNMALLSAEGREVPDGDPFWVRRVRDGDVVVQSDPPPTQSKSAPAKEA
jgi:hypothetical protein